MSIRWPRSALYSFPLGQNATSILHLLPGRTGRSQSAIGDWGSWTSICVLDSF
jgi:hypothetical protein